jgi:hypothetical protein
MRAITIAILIVMLASAAAAQDASPPATDSAPPATVTPPPPTQDRPLTNGMGSIPQAPVGHRQPTLRDLPPNVLRDERSESDSQQRAVNPLGGVPSICSGC